MTREELFSKVDDALKTALEDSIIVMNSDGNILSKRSFSDDLEFSPKLDCSKDISAVIFDDEEGARRTIDDILVPQEPEESFFAIRIAKTTDDNGESTIEISTDGNADNAVADDLLKNALDTVIPSDEKTDGGDEDSEAKKDDKEDDGKKDSDKEGKDGEYAEG